MPRGRVTWSRCLGRPASSRRSPMLRPLSTSTASSPPARVPSLPGARSRARAIACSGRAATATSISFSMAVWRADARTPSSLPGCASAARNWACFDALVRSLRVLAGDETLLVQSGKPVGVFRSHPDAPRVLIRYRLEELGPDQGRSGRGRFDRSSGRAIPFRDQQARVPD